MSKKIFIVICVAVLVVLGTFLLIQQTSQNTPSSTVSPTPFSSGTNPVSFQEIPFPSLLPVAVIQDPGVVWFSKASKISTDLSILKPDYDIDGLEFYKIGTQNDKDLIVVLINYGIGGDAPYLLRKEIDRYALVTGGIEPFSNKVYEDYKTKLNSIAWPEQLVMHGVKFSSGGYGFSSAYFFDDEKDLTWTLFANTPYGPMYYGKDPNLMATNPVDHYRFSLRAVNGVQVQYRMDYDFQTDDGVALFRWNDGSVNSARYSDGLSTGCGSNTSRILSLAQINGQVLQSGTTTAGEPIYEFIDINHPIVQEGYANTGGEYYEYSPHTDASVVKNLSLQEYHQNHGIVIYRDRLGRFIAFFNGTYAPQAECGKPVIYLYPEKPTQVSVKVGADIRISEPKYIGGWNVLAQPDGKLTNAQGTYSSLFWEGLGHGPYPEITQGFVVKSENMEATLRKHLSQLGANARESQDFLDFWLEKMPTTPYTRLTWFGTEEMDILAPLYVHPKPDTVIRVFLDFAGLEKPIDLPQQELSSIPRLGFDLFEWGGLLRNGYHTNP